MKKTLAIILAMLMLLGMFAGCASDDAKTDDTSSSSSVSTSTSSSSSSSDKKDDKKEEALPEGKKVISTSKGDFTFNEEGYPVTDEPSTFSIIAATSVADIENSPMMKLVSEETNVYPEWQIVAKTAAEERKALIWASNDYPDVLGPGMINKDDCNIYGPGGILMSLNDYYKYLTNLEEFIGKPPASLYSFDGNIYYYPTITLTDRGDPTTYANVKWLDKLGLEMPTTIDEFYDCLIAIRDGDPNGNGKKDEIAFVLGGWSPADYLPNFVSMLGTPGGYYIDDAGTVHDGRIEEQFKEEIKLIQKFYSEGLMDSELFTQDLTALRTKGAAEEQLFGFMTAYQVAYYVGDARVDDYEAMPLLENLNGEKSYMLSNSSETGTTVNMAVSVSCECPEIVARWVDYMMTPEITIQIDYAPFGIGYEVDENGTLIKLTDAPEGFDSITSWRESNNEQQFPRIQNFFMSDYFIENYNYDPYESMTVSRKKGAVAAEAALPYKIQEFPASNISPTLEESEELAFYTADLDKYYLETIATWITSAVDIDVEWDGYVEKMKSMSADRVIEIKQIQADRYFGK